MSSADARRAGVAAALVGRAPELALVRSFLERARVGGAALLLSGEPGVGKTALLDAAAEMASDAGTTVLRAAGSEFEADIALSGLNQLLHRLLGEVSQLCDVHREALLAGLGYSTGTSTDRLTMSSGALALLQRVSAASPLLVLVDDLQWLDRSSAAVLGFVARRLVDYPIGLIIAWRTGAGSFSDLGGLPEHQLQPLDEDAAAALLSTRFPALAAGVRRRVQVEAEGNPLALLEFPVAMNTSQRTAQRPLPAVLPLTRRLQALFASRVADLPPVTRRLLLRAALDGTARSGVLQAAIGSEFTLHDLQPAERNGLVVVDEDGRRLLFRHPVVRSTIVDFATEGERREAHRALADDLADQPERRALHMAAAAPGPDEQVARLLEHAARGMLRRGDAVAAVDALLRAADLSPGGPERSRRLAQAAFVGADVTGGLQTVTQLLDDACAAGPSESLQPAVAAAYLLLNGEGDVATAHRLLVAAIEDKAGGYDAEDEALVEALHTLLSVCFFAAGCPELWKPFHAALARLRPRPPDVLALCATTFADPARTTATSLTELDAIISRLPDEGDPARIVWIGRAAFFVDRMSACRDAQWRVVRDGRKGGAVASAIAALINLCLDDVLTGRWDEAQQTAEEGLELCAAHGYRLLEWPLWFGQALLAAHRRDLDTAAALTERMTGWAAPRRAGTVQLYARYVRTVVALGEGDAEEAYRQAAGISPPGTLASHVPLALWAAMDLVESAVRTGRHDRADAHVAALRDAGVAALSPRLALLTAGSVAMAAPPADATQLFGDALAVPGIERWPLDLARVRLAFGERLRRSHAAAEARTQLTQALAAFERLDARTWAARTRTELRAAGPDDHQGSSALTPQEREIAMLAATGLTNKEIGQRLYLSHRTVGAHLYRLFPKLGITSRAALRDALHSEPATRSYP